MAVVLVVTKNGGSFGCYKEWQQFGCYKEWQQFGCYKEYRKFWLLRIIIVLVHTQNQFVSLITKSGDCFSRKKSACLTDPSEEVSSGGHQPDGRQQRPRCHGGA